MGSQTVQQQWLAAIRDGDDGLKSGPVAVLYVLATFMDSDGRNCRPGMARVAEGARCTRSTAFEHLRKAAAAGWVEVRQRRGASVYVPCIGGVPLVPNPPPNRPGFQDGEPSVDNPNRPGNQDSRNRPGTQDSELPTVRVFGANRPANQDGTIFDQEVQLASSPRPHSDKADKVLTAHGIPLSDRPSIEQYLREQRKATSPGGLIATLGDRGEFGPVIPLWQTWATPTEMPPHVNGNGASPAAPCPQGCVDGWLGDVDRPAPCPTHKPHRTNGHHR